MVPQDFEVQTQFCKKLRQPVDGEAPKQEAGDGEEKVHAPDWCGRKLRLGPRGEKVYCTQGECARQAPGCLSHSTGKAQNAGAAFCSALFWNTQGLEPRAAQGTLHIEQPGA